MMRSCLIKRILIPSLPLFQRNIACLPVKVTTRNFVKLFRRTPYDEPGSENFKLRVVTRKHWELLPLFAVTVFGMSMITFFSIWSFLHKVDVDFWHNHKNLSRTMDLSKPDGLNHQLITINQQFKPWPEMAALLKKMEDAEKKQKHEGLQKCDSKKKN